MAALCARTASKQGTAAIVHCLNFLIAESRCSLWTEHVASSSNVADGGSRDEDVKCSVARRCGVPLERFEYPACWPKDMCNVDFNTWLSLLVRW